MTAPNSTLRIFLFGIVVFSDLCWQEPFLPVAYVVWSSCRGHTQALKDPGYLALEPGTSPWTAPMSVCAGAMFWPHHPELSLGQRCHTDSMYVPTLNKHQGLPGAQGWGQWGTYCPSSITRNMVLDWQCLPRQYPLDMPGMGYASHQLSSERGKALIPPLPWVVIPLGQVVRRQSEGHKPASGFPRPWMEQHKPQARRNLKGNPCRAPRVSECCSFFSLGGSFLQADREWLASKWVRCNFGVKTLPWHLHRNNRTLRMNSQ